MTEIADEAEIIHSAMSELPREMEELLRAHYHDDVSLEDLARATGVSVDAMRERLGRANHALDELIAREPRWVALVQARSRAVHALLADDPRWGARSMPDQH